MLDGRRVNLLGCPKGNCACKIDMHGGCVEFMVQAAKIRAGDAGTYEKDGKWNNQEGKEHLQEQAIRGLQVWGEGSVVIVVVVVMMAMSGSGGTSNQRGGRKRPGRPLAAAQSSSAGPSRWPPAC